MEKSGKYIFVKILLLAFFLMIANAWLAYHIGNDFIETYFVGGVVVFFGFVSFLVKYLKKEDEEKFTQIYQRWLAGFLNFQVIFGLYVLLFVAGCFVSSVHISTGKKQAPVSILMTQEGRSSLDAWELNVSNESPSVQQTVITSPFGRTFNVRAKGYQQLSFQVYPWTGKRINLENDLEVSPTVIARVPVEFFMQLARAKLLVKYNKQIETTYDLNNHATIILGQLPGIPEHYFEKWLIELRSMYDEQTVYSSLNRWTVQEPLFIPVDFQVYDSLKLELTSSGGDKFAVCEGVLGTEAFKEFQFKAYKE
ncbi:hypothetical protein BC643_3503 [Mangrovibacterium diazotrophicum]|uniref:Uncharacterized protein n=2 Tax=Mangrovibacterium diazotrophicum TaxID=1261403 RepID=A0A419VYW5_9BACT|nr:hypothetical protein BC643_3503 [Mangrovibacterium diazotrophicum]